MPVVCVCLCACARGGGGTAMAHGCIGLHTGGAERRQLRVGRNNYGWDAANDRRDNYHCKFRKWCRPYDGRAMGYQYRWHHYHADVIAVGAGAPDVLFLGGLRPAEWNVPMLRHNNRRGMPTARQSPEIIRNRSCVDRAGLDSASAARVMRAEHPHHVSMRRQTLLTQWY